MIRSVCMLIVGFGALIQGSLRLGNPSQAVEKSGWLYQQFGDQGVAIGMIVLGAAALGIGVVVFKTRGFVQSKLGNSALSFKNADTRTTLFLVFRDKGQDTETCHTRLMKTRSCYKTGTQKYLSIGFQGGRLPILCLWPNGPQHPLKAFRPLLVDCQRQPRRPPPQRTCSSLR